MNSVKRHWSSFQRNWHRVLRFAAHRSGCAKDVKVHPVPLLGGLESAGVLKLEITWTSRRGKPCSDCFVLKRLVGSWTRELPIYEALADTPAADAIPRLLGAEVLDPTEVYMYLELLSTQNLWLWKHKEKSVAVLHQLAKVHAVSCPGLRAIQDWDYETDIQYAAESTVKSFVSLVHLGMATGGRPMLRPLERIVTTLPAMRTALNSWQKPVLLHGDMHTGNVAWRIEKGAGHTAVLLDWGRARPGSPLEDVSSWLQSLGYWEPEVKRRHDTLLRSYLVSRQMPDHLSPELRQVYWMAAVCNGMAGALQYHLTALADPARSNQDRLEASRAVRDWLRIIRRADACWRN